MSHSLVTYSMSNTPYDQVDFVGGKEGVTFPFQRARDTGTTTTVHTGIHTVQYCTIVRHQNGRIPSTGRIHTLSIKSPEPEPLLFGTSLFKISASEYRRIESVVVVVVELQHGKWRWTERLLLSQIHFQQLTRTAVQTLRSALEQQSQQNGGRRH